MVWLKEAVMGSRESEGCMVHLLDCSRQKRRPDRPPRAIVVVIARSLLPHGCCGR